MAPLRVRVDPDVIQRYIAVAKSKGIPVSDLHRAALERAADPRTLEQLAEELKS